MPALLGAGVLGFVGLALLLPVAPMRALHNGADDFGAGLVNAVLMACTVLAQLSVGLVLRRLRWPVTLAIGLALFLNGTRVTMETTDKIGQRTSPLG
jgi:hypothetical protein